MTSYLYSKTETKSANIVFKKSIELILQNEPIVFSSDKQIQILSKKSINHRGLNPLFRII